MQDLIAPASMHDRTGRSEEEIELWLVRCIAQRAERLADDIDITLPLSYYGMDSIGAACISGELEIWLEIRLSPLLVWDYPSIQLLASHLAASAPDSQAVTPDPPISHYRREGSTWNLLQ
jgi:acyl carrier protein